MKEEVINSLGIKDYLEEYLNDSENTLQEKIIRSNFLNEYIDKPLYVVEFIRNGEVFLRVENEDDEKISKELLIGTVIKDETTEDFELLLNSDHTINFHVDSILADDSISSDDKIFMIKDYLKYLNKGLYKQDATDKDGNMVQLIMNQTTDEIIEKIYY